MLPIKKYGDIVFQNIIIIISILILSGRLEEVNLKKRYGVAKVVGTVVSIGGATVITLYKGHPLLSQQLKIFIQQQHLSILSSTQILNWTLGCVYILTHIISWSAWIVLQVS